MCVKRRSVIGHIRGKDVRLDSCLRRRIERLNQRGIVTLACCCGHGRYPTTIVVRHGKVVRELRTGVVLSAKRRFYRTDEEGFYYIPQVMARREHRRT